MKSATLFALLASATARAPPPPPSSKPQLSPPTKPILSPYVREVYLRAVDRKIQKDTAHAEWYSANGERVLTRMLDALLGGGGGEPDSGPWGERDEQALWLLCRTLLGCIEAALLELGDASARVSRARRRWRSHGSPSQAFGEACVRNAVRVKTRVKQAFHQVLADRAEAEAAAAEEAGEAFASLQRGAAANAANRAKSSDDDEPSWTSRLGMGARRRMLMRSERSLQGYAGALHDLRVALRSAGGEWLELGRWLGGPPLPSMGWEVQLSAERRRQLVVLTGRACASLHELADRLRDSKYGPYGLYDAPPVPEHLPLATDGKGKRGDERNDLDASSTVLLTQTQQALKALREFRQAVRSRAAGPLSPPGPLQRHGLAALVACAAVGLAARRLAPELTPTWRQDASEAVRKASSDVGRFVRTHINEPIAGIATELFTETPPVIDPDQVRETGESFKRTLADFVRSVHKGSEEELAEALKRADEGDMAEVTKAYERAAGAPVSGLFVGELPRALLLQLQYLRVIMEQELEAIDSLLRRNDFNLQLMATVPALMLGFTLVFILRFAWQRLRSSNKLGPIDNLRAELQEIEGALGRAPAAAAGGLAETEAPLSVFELTPLPLHDVGELVFRVQNFRAICAKWLRGRLRSELLHDAQLLLDSGRLDASQRALVARSISRRLENVSPLLHHW